MNSVQSAAAGGEPHFWRALAVSVGLCGLWMAGQHPLWPVLACVGLVLVAMLAWRSPGAGVVALAVGLPVVDVGILTGPWRFSEADLLVLAVLAGTCGAASRSANHRVAHAAAATGFLALTGVIAVAGMLPLAGMASDAQTWQAWDGTKAFVWAALLVPLWQVVSNGSARWWVSRWLKGCVGGLALVCLLALWELLLDGGLPLSTSGYRTVAAFWEMRLGGGAIDAYLALTMPMLLWLWLRERRALHWWLLALLGLAAFQVLMSTQSRAVLGAVVVAMLVQGALVWRQPRLVHWRAPQRRHALIVLLVLVTQVVWSALGGSGMQQRLSQSSQDLMARIAHWQRGLSLLGTPAEQWLGLGAGQWSPRYGSIPGRGEFPGQATWRVDDDARWRLRLSGPVSDPAMGAMYGVVQRIASRSPGTHEVGLVLRSDRSAVLLLSVCERYLIYDRRCQWHRLPVAAASDDRAFQTLHAVLKGSPLDADGSLARWRPRMFGMSVLTPGATVTIEAVSLRPPSGREALLNGDFRQGPARWVEAAQGGFQPWHMDNLYVQFWMERGLAGTGALLLVLGLALLACLRAVGRLPGQAPALLASLVALAALGMFISVSELPRLTLLLWLTLGASWLMKPKTSHIRGM